jgi:hypothetical protein
LTKYCTRCGTQNDDEAQFCTACGQRLVDQGALNPQGADALPPSPPASRETAAKVFRFSMSHGDHKFILGSVDFQDESGRVVYTASRESALHQNYTLTQGESRFLFMKHKLHLSGYTFEMQDGSGAPAGEIHCRFTGRKGQLPEYWYTDPQGNSQAAIAWEEGTIRFVIGDPNSTRVFATVSAELPGGVMGDLKALSKRRFMVSAVEGTSLPLPVVLAFCVTIADMPVL